ncbi:MAG TPA: hypothetical protein VGM21_13080 [Actinomycetota bacterium]
MPAEAGDGYPTRRLRRQHQNLAAALGPGPGRSPRSTILPTTPIRSSHAALKGAAPAPLVALLLSAILLLAAGCTSGKRDQGTSAPSQSQTSAAPPAKPLKIEVRAAAQGPQHGFNAKAAAQKATPNMQRFLQRYVSVAFLDPDQRRSGWRELLALFDGSVQGAARRDIDSLSLGSDAAKVSSVQPDRAKASVLFLYRGGSPVGATVKLSFAGSAAADGGSGPVRMRSVFQLLSTPAGWRIAAYQSRTGASA